MCMCMSVKTQLKSFGHAFEYIHVVTALTKARMQTLQW